MMYRAKNLPCLVSIVHYNGHGTHNQRRRMENPRRTLGTDGAAASPTKIASAGLPQSSRSRPECNERDLVRASNRLPVERSERHGYLQQFLGSSAIHGMGRCRNLPGILGVRTSRLRRSGGYQLVLALDGRCFDQGAAWRGKKPVPIQRIVQRKGRSEVCSPKPRASLSASRSTAPIETTSSWLSRRSRASLSNARSRPRESSKVCVWTRATTTMKRGSWCGCLVSQHTSAPGAKKPRPSKKKLGLKREDGWWNAPTVG